MSSIGFKYKDVVNLHATSLQGFDVVVVVLVLVANKRVLYL